MRKFACSLALASFTMLTTTWACAGLLAGLGVATVDSTGANRSSYSNNDTIGLQQRVNNSIASTNRVLFSFQIKSPSGGAAFSQTGNAVPGSVGNSQSQLTGVPISSFFSVPGTYTLQAFAQLDGQVLIQTVSFTVSSPNIILTYPPNGSQNLTDSPLTFQWVGSGAATYVVTVGDNPSFYNSVFSQNATPGQSSLSYPINPSNPLQQLATGQVYYWRVQGLDINGNLLATSQPPYSFSVASPGLTRDLAVVSLAIAGPADPSGNIPFTVVVKDQGGTTEANVPLQFSLAGLVPTGSPVMITSISPGVSLNFNFSAAIPPGQANGMAVACLQFFDAVMANNCQSLNVTAAAGVPGSQNPTAAPVNETPEQIWQQIEQLLAAQGISLTEYQLTGIEGQLTADQLAALLDALRQGQAQILLSGPPLVAPLPGAPTQSTGTASFAPTLPPETPLFPVSFSTAPGLSAGLTDQTPDQIWQQISTLLTAQGVDLTGYSLSSIEGSMTADQLAGLLAALKQGVAQITISGPPLSAAGAAPAAPPTQSTSPVAAIPPTAPGVSGSAEWSGIAPPLSDDLRTFTINDDGAWRRLWPHLSSDPIPDVDFGRYCVVGIIAGKIGSINDIDLEDIKKSRGGLRVRYRVSAQRIPGGAQAKSVVPYILRVAPRTGRAAQFIQIKEEPKDGENEQQ